MSGLERFLPFLAWFPIARATLRADLVAGITVALILVPQSMAYAQLAGLPAHYGLYTAFVPVLVAGLWGSSGRLSTGPVAVVSLITAAALTPIAAQGSEGYIALAIGLAFLVGCIQLALGLFRLGFVVSFLSHPVIAGFASAAAIIIALSQLNKLLGVPMPRSQIFLADVWGVLQQIGDTHWPTLAFGLGSLAAMLAFRRWSPRLPGVLMTVAAATAVSAAVGFDRSATATVASLVDPEARALAADVLESRGRLAALAADRTAKQAELARTDRTPAGGGQHALALGYQIELIALQIADLEAENGRRLRLLRKLTFELGQPGDGVTRFYPFGAAPAGDGVRWRIQSIDDRGLRLAGGGEVVGAIPPGLPDLGAPHLDASTLALLLSTALVISVVGFMEAISIAKAIAARTRERLDVNRELVAQGLANLAGSFAQCYPASGSFSRSAVNYQAGARTGLASVVAALIVMLTLLALTPLLYHLPQAVLAAVIMLAAIALVRFGDIGQAWRVQRHDGIAGAVTFFAVLALAPHLDLGILAGAALSIGLFLYRTMRPRVAVLGRHPDGALRDAAVHGLTLSDHIVAVRFDGQLYFANVPYFEDSLLGVSARFPKARFILVVADGINQIDASGVETVRLLAERLRASGVTLAFSGLKKQVRDVFDAAGLTPLVGAENLFVDENQALAALAARVTDPDFDRTGFPLLQAPDRAPRGRNLTPEQAG